MAEVAEAPQSIQIFSKKRKKAGQDFGSPVSETPAPSVRGKQSSRTGDQGLKIGLEHSLEDVTPPQDGENGAHVQVLGSDADVLLTGRCTSPCKPC